MKKSFWPAVPFFIACASPQVQEGSDYRFQTVGSIERLDSAINNLIAGDAEIEILASGFDWSEGPLWLEDHQALIFSDVPANKVYRWSEKDSLSLYLSPSGYFGDRTDKKEPGSNGLALDADKNLVLCQHGERQIGKMLAPLDDPKSDFQALATNFEGKQLNSPNDLIYNSKNQLFFTDPPYGLDPWDDKELDFQGVYRLDPDGDLTLLIDSLSRPNGVALNPDESKMYIAQSDPEKAQYFEYLLDENGNVISGRLLLDVTELQSPERKGLPDGLKVHASGTIFATGPGGVLVISPEGKHLGTIATGEATANCAFDTEQKYLYMTADSYLMRISLK